LAHPNIRVDTSDTLGRIVIDRPEAKNAMSLAMVDAIAEAARQLDASAEVRVISITGAGDIFSAGVDLKELPPSRETPEKARAYDDRLSAAVAALAACRKPTVALIDGAALGAAMAFTLACDVRLGSPRAHFRVPVPRLGLFYSATDTRRLVELVGPARAKWLMMSGEAVGADEALSWGLLTKLSGADEFGEACASALASLAAGAPLSLVYTKKVIDGPAVPDPALVDEAYRRIYGSGDPAEGLAAAREKRPPKFKGE